jgi:hypothetical protein
VYWIAHPRQRYPGLRGPEVDLGCASVREYLSVLWVCASDARA